MKTICFFNSSQTWGGGEKWHFDIAQRLSSKNYKIIVFTNSKSELYDRLKETTIKVYPVKITNTSFLNPIKLNSVTKILRKEKVDSIIINLSSDLKIAGLAAKKAGIKQIIYRRGLATPISNSLLNRFLFGKIITNVICNSEDTYNTVFQHNKNFISNDKVSIIYNGIDLAEYDQRNSKALYQAQNNEIIIGNAGRLVEQKGQQHFIEIAKILREKGLRFKILIAGKGPLQDELETLIKQNDLENHIQMIGFVHDIKSFMQGLDIFVLTSYWEGFGYVLVEAMACSKPVIAFNMTSNPEIIEEYKTGFLCTPKDATEMSDKIYTLMTDVQLKKQMGKNGRKRVEERFEINRTLEEVEALLSKA